MKQPWIFQNENNDLSVTPSNMKGGQLKNLYWILIKLKKGKSPLSTDLVNSCSWVKWERSVVIFKFMYKINIQYEWPSKLFIDDQYTILKETICRSIMPLFLSNKNSFWSDFMYLTLLDESEAFRRKIIQTLNFSYLPRYSSSFHFSW